MDNLLHSITELKAAAAALPLGLNGRKRRAQYALEGAYITLDAFRRGEREPLHTTWLGAYTEVNRDHSLPRLDHGPLTVDEVSVVTSWAVELERLAATSANAMAYADAAKGLRGVLAVAPLSPP